MKKNSNHNIEIKHSSRKTKRKAPSQRKMKESLRQIGVFNTKVESVFRKKQKYSDGEFYQMPMSFAHTAFNYDLEILNISYTNIAFHFISRL